MPFNFAAIKFKLMFENNMNMSQTVKPQTTNFYVFHFKFVFYTEIKLHSNCSE